MIPPKTFRPVAALVLSVGLFLALPGCGSGDKPAADNKDKKDDKKDTSTPTPTPNRTPAPEPPKPPEKVDFTVGVGKDAMDFLQAVRMGMAKPEQLSAGFVKAIGLPTELPSDKEKGYSASAAEGWLSRLGMSTGFGPAFHAKQTGDAAFIRGGLVGKQGGYSLRMVKDGAAWRTDWLSASSVEIKGAAAVPANDADAIAREFAATALFEAICDKDAMPQSERWAVIAAGLTPALRKAWADPFDGDKAKGYDYSPTKLGVKVAEIGGNAESLSFTPQGDAFRVEVTKAGGAKAAYLVKLVKGTTPGQWLVESITPQ